MIYYVAYQLNPTRPYPAHKLEKDCWETNDADNGTLIYPPFWVKYIAGAKVGFIGFTEHLVPKRQSPAYSEGIGFTHATDNVAKYIKYLKEVEGCGIIFIDLNPS